ncbi:MAG TPA: GAF domain-containing protein, partial [Thermoanaerobaculia bacterium]|nr:GAF domain-containing protein [Thermoanaerobaculia bacterium]
MRHRQRWRHARPWLEGVYWVLLVSVALLAAAPKIPVGSSWASFAPVAFLRAVQPAWTVPCAAGLAAIAAIKSRFSSPWLWGAVHDILTGLQQDLFKTEFSQGQPRDLHRVTLFKRCGWRWARCKWPHSGWLLAVSRSGHTTQSSESAFRAPDTGPAERAEGFAGSTWRTDEIILKENLPDVSSDPTKEQIEEYAKSTWCKVEYVKQRKPAARSYVGVPIHVKGRPWGVLIIDSANPKAKSDNSELRLYGTVQ